MCYDVNVERKKEQRTMTYKYEFSGISTNDEPNREQFVEMYDGTLIKKEPFTVYLDDDREVKLHTYIQHTDMSEYDDTEEQIITIGVVPEFTDLSEKHQEDLLGQYDMPEDREKLKQDTVWQLEDAISYGFGLPLHTVTLENTDNVEHTINSAVAVHSAVEGLIGFDLDKPLNRIGSTGWDFLDDYCCDKDYVSAALSRIN